MKVHKIQISRDALLRAVAQVVKETSVGMASMDCIAMNAVLVDAGHAGVKETFPLDTIEVELVSAQAAPVKRVGKLSLAAVDGARVA